MFLAAGFGDTLGAATPEEMLAEATRVAGTPAMTAAVITSTSIEVYTHGVRRLGGSQHIEARDAFHVGSDAKAMLATLVAQEVEQGRLRWDTTIGEILPEAVSGAREDYRDVTVADLLAHRSGLIALYTLDELAAVPALHGNVLAQRLQFTSWVLQQPPAAPPHTMAVYSNAGYVVVAALLERITGRSYEELLQRRLFAPLGIVAAFDWPAACDRRAPWGHALIDGSLRPVNPRDPAFRIPSWANPAGNLSLSTRDFARFVRLHLRGLRGVAGLLQPASFTQLHTPQGEYALGWAVAEVNGHLLSYHQGASGLFYALMIIDAEADVAAVVLANSDTDAMELAATQLALGLMQWKVQP
ncbi:MAG: beta-lactamase family protein [Gammaproteobacteria bacterium]|nr:beta-lactamase family protein [Gammaproteobacteria bacterium]